MTGNIACCQNFWFWFLWPYLFFSTPMNLNSIYDLLFSSNSHDDNPSRCPYRPWSNNPSSNHRLFLLSCNMLTSLHGTRFSLTIHHRTAPEGSRNWSDHLSRPPASPERRAMAGRPVLRHNSTGVGAFSERWKKYGLHLKRKSLRLLLQIFSTCWTITQRDIFSKWELLALLPISWCKGFECFLSNNLINALSILSTSPIPSLSIPNLSVSI